MNDDRKMYKSKKGGFSSALTGVRPWWRGWQRASIAWSRLGKGGAGGDGITTSAKAQRDQGFPATVDEMRREGRLLSKNSGGEGRKEETWALGLTGSSTGKAWARRGSTSSWARRQLTVTKAVAWPRTTPELAVGTTWARSTGSDGEIVGDVAGWCRTASGSGSGSVSLCSARQGRGRGVVLRRGAELLLGVGVAVRLGGGAQHGVVDEELDAAGGSGAW